MPPFSTMSAMRETLPEYSPDRSRQVAAETIQPDASTDQIPQQGATRQPMERRACTRCGYLYPVLTLKVLARSTVLRKGRFMNLTDLDGRVAVNRNGPRPN